MIVNFNDLDDFIQLTKAHYRRNYAKTHIYNAQLFKATLENRCQGEYKGRIQESIDYQEFQIDFRYLYNYEGISEDRKDVFKGKDLHKAYLNQIKKFHSDNVQSQEQKKEFEEITKCIITAYEELKKGDNDYKEQIKSEKVIFKEEEEVAQTLFNKSYSEIKYSMYAPGNEEMRSKFIEELEKRKNKSSSTNTENKNQNNSTYRSPQYTQTAPSSQSDGSAAKFLALFALCGLFAIPILTKKESKKAAESQPNKDVKIRQYTEKQYDVMQLNSRKILMQPFQQFFNSLLKRRPHMLMYPLGKDPHILQQLTKYSIAPDIHLYEVPSKYFLNQTEANKIKTSNSVEGVQKYELTETKPNTLLTLSLEAERTLHNVYVLADDVINQIKEKGKFTPPKIFFKFHGYMMFQIRPKPLSSLQCYKNTKYISLFDLYFDFYSPIFFKRDHYRQYLTGFEQEAPLKNSRYFGNVYLNYRKIPTVYLQKGEKVVIMTQTKKTDASGQLKKAEQSYRESWEGYYARFQKNWKNYCKHQSEGKLVF